MRKLKLIFACLLMAVLSIGQVWAATETATLSFSAKCNGSGTDDQSNSWTVTSDGTESTYDSSKGIHYGTSSAQVQYIRLSTSGITGTITQVKVNASTASGVSATVGVTVGGAAFGGNPKSLTTSAAEYTFTDEATGAIVVEITKPSKAAKAIYCKSVEVTYSTGGGTVAVSSVTLDENAITLDEEATQTLTATVLPTNATNKNVTWESDDEEVATVVNGVVTAVGAGDATITCKSVADNTKSATCSVHVNPSPYTKSKLIFTAACGGSGTADDDAVWAVTSDGTESVYDATSGIHYGTGSANVTYLQLATSDIEGTVARVVVNTRDAQATATISVTVGGTAFTCESATATNTPSDYTFTGTGSGEIVVRVDRGSSMSKAIYVKSVVVYYIPAPQKQNADLLYAEADQKKLAKLGEEFSVPTLANPNGLTVSYASDNTDVAEVAANGAVTIKAVGVAEITASFAGDDTYKAGSAKYTIGVVAHEGTQADPYTVADAKVVIDALGGQEEVYVAGIVSTANLNQDNIDDYHNATYWISDDGTTASQLEAFRGKYLNNTNVTLVTDILVGDEVVIYGNLTKYGNTYEFAADNYLFSLNRNKGAAGLSYEVTAIEKNINAAEFTHLLTNPNNLDVTYSSSNENLAFVDENTGEVSVGDEEGTVTITASTNGDPTHLAGTATYTITIVDPSLTKVTFDATLASDIADDNDEGVTKSGINIKTTHTDGVNDQNNPIAYYQCFKNANLTVTSTVGNIKKIEFTTTGSNYASSGFAGVSNDKWTGDASEVVLTASGNQVRMSKIVVSYIPDTRAAAGLEWSTDAVVLTVGDAFTAPTLTNPNSIAAAEITIASDNTALAQVENGVVSLVANATGEATITATFEGNDSYKPATVSYLITVNEAGLDNVTFDATQDIAGTNELSITKGGFTLEFTNGALDNSENYRLYKNQTMTLSSTAYYIKKIEFTCTSGNPISGFADAEGLDKDNNQWTGQANSVELTASGAQVRIEKLKVYYIEDTRAEAGLAWDEPSVELTVGDAFTPMNLTNPHGLTVSVESDNTELATVENGVVSLVADATGTAHITATFAGNATYKPASVSYTIIVNDPTPEIITTPTANLNFGSVEQGATINAKNLQVTLQNVATATVAITGEGAAAFSADPMALSASGTITVSASSANIGTFAATLTISDDANQATAKEIHLSLTVTEPEAQETAVSTSSEWVVATEVADGMEVLITGVKSDVTYAVSEQATNNRTAAAGTLNEGIFTPGENTMSFTLVAQGEGTYALRTSNGKYLYAASSSANQLKTRDAIGEDGKAVWSISIGEGNVASIVANCTTTNWRNTMQFNQNGQNNPMVACYASASQSGIKLYIPYVAPQPQLDPIAEIGGKFIINAKGDTAVFSRGNLQYNYGTDKWYVAEHQYDFLGEAANLNFGKDGYDGAIDLFGWSNDDSNYGRMLSNKDADYMNNHFVDWGGLFSGDKAWSTFNTTEMKYVLANQKWTTMVLDPTPEDADNGDEIYGLAMFPYNWVMPAGYEGIHYSLHDWNDDAGFADNTIALSAWADFENAGAVFLPMAGARAGYWGNTWNGDVETATSNPAASGYDWVDNVGWYGYYWLSTPDSRSSYQHCANYLIFLGWGEGPTLEDDDDIYYPPQVWSREKRRGNSVRLITRIPRQYTVTYNAGEGAGTVPTDANKYLDGADVTLADASGLSKEGYVFAGWKFKGETYNDGTYTVNNVLANEEIVFEAQWEKDWQTVRGSLTSGNYYTVCYDKTMKEIRGASLWSFTGKDANLAYIVEAEAPFVAGTPYLIYAESEALEAVLQTVDNPVAGHYNGLYGTFEYLGAADLDGKGATHMLKNNEIRPLGNNNHLDAYRAYIILSEIGAPSAPAPGRRVRAIPLQKNTPTGIDALNASETPVKMLIDGQIYILRGEKIYDATGRLVK